MEYVNDPRKNIHSIYTKEKMINSYAFSNIPAILKNDKTVCWTDFTDINKVTLDGGGNVISVAPVKPALPVFTTNIGIVHWSDKGALLDGVSSNLTARFSPINTEPEFIIYYVMKQISVKPGTYNQFFENIPQHGQEPNTNRVYFWDGSHAIYGGYLPLNTDVIIQLACYTLSDGKSFISTNGVKTFASGPFLGGIPEYFLIGGTGNSYPSNIEVKELIIRTVRETDINESAIYNYLKAKYNI